MTERRITWLTIAAASSHFAISKKTLYSLVARGRLPKGAVLRLGRQLRINVAAIEAEAEGKK